MDLLSDKRLVRWMFPAFAGSRLVRPVEQRYLAGSKPALGARKRLHLSGTIDLMATNGRERYERMRLLWTAPLLALALAGCGEVGAIDFSLGGGAAANQANGLPQDLTTNAAPTTPVEAGALPPADGAAYDPGPVADGAAAQPGPLPPANAVAEPAPAAVVAGAAGVTVGRTDLLGGWTVTTGTDTCQLFMTLTAWTGGYRASTRDCASQTLMQISAWDLDGQQVTLALADGTALAVLAPVAAGRFEGQVIAGGTPISFFR